MPFGSVAQGRGPSTTPEGGQAVNCKLFASSGGGISLRLASTSFSC
ncbi:17287_t:CDS:2 [Acaulospora colombiana]|uniref:17287_t:CDS:1 n=1 Tax=Acaulospora colombiana TaxID=27376 RepID=A0ACA9K182_9GLOM|nr:17287_t:CDS:2 [Acaulospora colombiana]